LCNFARAREALQHEDFQESVAPLLGFGFDCGLKPIGICFNWFWAISILILIFRYSSRSGKGKRFRLQLDLELREFRTQSCVLVPRGDGVLVQPEVQGQDPEDAVAVKPESGVVARHRQIQAVEQPSPLVVGQVLDLLAFGDQRQLAVQLVSVLVLGNGRRTSACTSSSSSTTSLSLSRSTLDLHLDPYLFLCVVRACV